MFAAMKQYRLFVSACPCSCPRVQGASPRSLGNTDLFLRPVYMATGVQAAVLVYCNNRTGSQQVIE